MANVTRDSYDATKEFTTLRYQQGEPVADFELNEAQDIAQGYRGFKAQDLQEEGVSELTDFALSNFGAGDFDIAPGKLSREGLRYEILSTTAASALGLTLTAADGAQDRIDTVYLELRLIEINATTDPSIAVGSLGETAVRKKIEANLAVVEGTPGGAEGTVPASTGPIIAGGIARIPYIRLWRDAGSGTSLSAAYQKILPVSRSLRAWQDNHSTARIFSGVGWNKSTGEVTFGDPVSLPPTSSGYSVETAGGTTNSVAGVWTLANDDALWIIPNRFDEGSPTFYHRNATQPGVHNALAAYISPIHTGQPPGAVMVCMRADFRLILSNGQVISPPARHSTTAQNWAGPGTPPGDSVTWTVGWTANSAYPTGDFNGSKALETIAAIVNAAGSLSGKSALTVKFLPGVHTFGYAAAPTDNYIHFDLSTGTGAMNLRFEGAGQESTVIGAEMSNINANGAWLRVTGNNPSNEVTVECENIHFLEVAASRSNSSVSLIDLPSISSWYANRSTFNGSNAIRSGLSATGAVKGADVFRMRNCNVAVGDTGDVNKGQALFVQPTATSGTVLELENNTFLGAGETCGGVLINRFDTIRVEHNQFYVAGGAVALDAVLWITKYFTTDVIYPSRKITVTDNEFMFLAAESVDRSITIAIDMPAGVLDVSRNTVYAQPVDTHATGSGQVFRWPQITVFDSVQEGFATPTITNSIRISDNRLLSEEVLTRVASGRFGCIQVKYTTTSRHFIRSNLTISGNEIIWTGAPPDITVYPTPIYVERGAASAIGLVVVLKILNNTIKENALGGGYYFGAISVVDLAGALAYVQPVVSGNTIELNPDNHASADIAHGIFLDDCVHPVVNNNSISTRNVAVAAGENSTCIYMGDSCTEGVINNNQLYGTVAVRTGATQYAFITGNNSRLSSAGGGLAAYVLGVNSLQANNRIV